MSTYSSQFYDTIRAGTRSSASVLVPIVHDIIRPARVIDVGCGEGWWAAGFAARGCTVLGVDGGYVDNTASGIPYLAADLERPLPVPNLGVFDLAICLEVAEHLAPQRAPGFVDELCQLAPVVVFSAAIPGQGGAGHINERPTGYWTSLFRGRGRVVSGALRWMVWGNNQVEFWYQQNLLVAADAARSPALAWPDLFDTPAAEPWPVVHPTLFNARRQL
jgi:SAM-dependent methyltransferase